MAKVLEVGTVSPAVALVASSEILADVMVESLAVDVAAIGRIDAVEKILEVICRTTGMGFSAVARVTDSRWIACAVRDEIAFGLEPGGELELATTICHEIRQSGDSVVIDHVAADAAYCGHPTPQKYGFQSYVSVPIVRADGEFFGTLCAIDPRPARVNTPQTVGMFKLFAELIAAHLDAQDRMQLLSDTLAERQRAEADRLHLLAAEQAARSEAERQGRIKDEFLATLSHELRTPLNAIVGWTQILKSGGGSSEDVAEGIAVIDRNARAQTQIIEDILDMSRIVSGKLRLDVQRVDVAALVRAGVDTVQPAVESKGIQLRAVLDPAAGPISGDPNRLHQVFWNLLSNAVKFTPRGGRVEVTLTRAAGHVEISVSDSGEGIEPAFLPFVFDRFRQADASITRKHAGLGLGLAIVKQLVELHGGSVRAQSAGRGRGATFIVALPLAAVPAEYPAPEPTDHLGAQARLIEHPLSPGELDGVSVIVVDDEPDGRAVVKRLLEGCGATVRTAGSAAEALRLIAAEPPSVLLSDVGMPEEDGYSFIRRVRSLEDGRGRGIPAIALTAYARAADRVRALEAGFQTHLAKPVEPAELIVTVAAMARTAVSSAS